MPSGGGQDQVAVFAVGGEGEARVPNRRCPPPYHLGAAHVLRLLHQAVHLYPHLCFGSGLRVCHI